MICVQSHVFFKEVSQTYVVVTMLPRICKLIIIISMILYDVLVNCSVLFLDTPTTTSPLQCSDGQFACSNNELCISLNWKCDGEFDCADKSDESIEECGKLMLFNFHTNAIYSAQ